MYWEATVKKMKKPFGAQFADDEIPAIVDYLVKTYGAERSAVTASSVPAPAAKPISAAGIVSHEPHALMSANNCMACHAVDRKVVGPAFREVAAKYAGRPDALQQLSRTIRAGGAGKWGAVPMPSFSHLSDEEAQTLARHILSQ
jgi:sulfite dehydrogenase